MRLSIMSKTFFLCVLLVVCFGALAATATSEAAWAGTVRLSAGVLGLGVTALIFWSQWQAVRRIRSFVETADGIIQRGDLTQKFKTDDDDELGELARSLDQFIMWLREFPGLMQSSAQSLAAAASEICAAAQEQEAAAQQQAAAVEEVSATTMSLLEAAAHIAETATSVLANAERTKDTSEVITKKIAELSNHTGRMSEILEVIRDIADRSDLLALNASLEGMRAGEAGRGFSLVASEMRRLAERVTASVHNVKALVTDVRGSGSSTVMVTEEARKLAESTTESARQISRVTDQQRSSTEQVAQSMKEISTVIGQTVSASRQTLSAAEALKNQAQSLLNIVKQFHLDARAQA